NLAIDGAGAIWAWGKGKYGQLGDNQLHADFNPTPRQVQFPEPVHVVDVAAGNYLSLAVDSRGQVWGWGRDPLVLGDANPWPGPRKLAGLADIETVALGQNHAMALTAAGKVLVWGRNPEGLGDGVSKSSATPIEIGGLGRIIAIASGAQFMLAVDEDGKLWAWGMGRYGQLGRADQSAAVPVEVPGVRIAVPEPHPRLGEQDLGATTLGQPGKSRVFTIENYGTGPLTLGAITLEGADAGSFTLTPPAQLVLQPGERTSLSVVFSPKIAGDKQATLKIVSDDVGDEDYEVSLLASAAEPAPLLGLSTQDPADAPDLTPLRFDFGAIEGDRRTVSLVITNVGGGKLELTGDPALKLDSEVFSVDTTTLARTLAAGESTSFTVTFDPKVNDPVTTQLLIETNVGPTILTLDGARIGPVLEISRGGQTIDDGVLDFGQQGLGSKGSKLVLTLRNAGNRPLHLEDLQLGGADAQDFKLEGLLPAALEVSASCELSLQFTPRSGGAAGPRQASLSLRSDDPERPKTAFVLRGEARSAVVRGEGTSIADWRGMGLLCDRKGHLRMWSSIIMLNPSARFHDGGAGGAASVVFNLADKTKLAWVLTTDGLVHDTVAKTLQGAGVGPALAGIDAVAQIGAVITPIKYNSRVKASGPNNPLTWDYSNEL
ncbi:MAG: choice-of-anchor D domain-containing protein, partial [Myxococcales bacterium]|nr:choice-of-anchor D domain-containing protein [Myxococcales bacterium]